MRSLCPLANTICTVASTIVVASSFINEPSVSLVGPTALPAFRQAAVAQSLELYRAGHFDQAVSELLGGKTVSAISSSFKRDASKWADQAAPSDRARRISTAAAMAAELMETSFHQQWLEYRDSRELFEWACSRIRRLDPSEFEKWFHLVGLALMQGAGDESLLSGTRNYRYYRTALPIPGGESHPKHAGLRFPLEPRFRLAYVTTALETQFLATWPLPPAYLTNDMAGRFEIERGGSAAQTADTLKALASLFGNPSVSHEARLRSGVLRFLLGEVDESKTQLAQAVSSEDRTLRYIAYLMLGAIADRENRLPEALEHYRRAYETVAASASSIALASALYRTGRETEAADVIQKFNQREPQADPWRLYGQRDYRFLSEYRANMRNALLRLR